MRYALLAWLAPPVQGSGGGEAVGGGVGSGEAVGSGEMPGVPDTDGIDPKTIEMFEELGSSIFNGFEGLDAVTVTGLGLVAFILFALVLFAAFAGLRWLLRFVPMSKARRAGFARWRPVAEAALALVYLLLGVSLVFRAESPLVLTLLFFGLFGVLWSPLRDFISGMLIKAQAQCQIGDRVSVGDRVGVVRRLGYLTLTFESEDGAEVFVPYRELARQSIVRTPRVEGLHRHSFDVELPKGVAPLSGIAAVKRLAMSSHWASVVREPEVEPLARGGLRVHVFALGHEHGPAIEATVRAGLRELID